MQTPVLYLGAHMYIYIHHQHQQNTCLLRDVSHGMDQGHDANLVGAASSTQEPSTGVKEDAYQHLRQAHKGGTQADDHQVRHGGDACWRAVMRHVVHGCDSDCCKSHCHGLDVKHPILHHTTALDK